MLSVLQRILAVSRRPLAWWIGALGVAVGFPAGRLLREPPWNTEIQARRPARTPDQAPAEGLQPAASAVNLATGAAVRENPARTEAVRVAEELADAYKRWRDQTGAESSWVPLHLMRQATALAERGDVDQVLIALSMQRPPAFSGAVLSAWADRDPTAAWEFWLGRLKERHQVIGSYLQFVRRTARYHRALVEPHIETLSVTARDAAEEIWRQRLEEEAPDPGRLQRTILTEVPEAMRALCVDRALWVLAAEHPEQARALLENLPEAERAGFIPRFAELLARGQPAMALDLVRKHPGDMYYAGRDDRDSADLVLSAMLRREAVAPALKLMAEFHGQNLIGESSQAVFNLPRRPGEWMPAAVTAAQGQPGGADFLSELIRRCPRENCEDFCAEIAGISDSALQTAAAEAWAWRWSAQDPDAARRWLQGLPPVARARALCGLWAKGAEVNEALEACRQAGTQPSESVLTEMVLAEPERTNRWLAEQPGVTSRELARAAWTWSSSNPQAAAEWAAGFSDSGVRVQAVAAVMQVWLHDAPEAAAAWLESAPLDDAEWSAVQTFTGLNALSEP